MSLEFHREIKAIDGRPYEVRINAQYNNVQIIKTTYSVERIITSYTGRVRHSIYIKENEGEYENEKFIIIFPEILKKYLQIKDSASDQEIASLKNPVLCSYSTGEHFDGDPKYSIVMTNHRSIIESQSFLEFKNFVKKEVTNLLIGDDSGVEYEII